MRKLEDFIPELPKKQEIKIDEVNVLLILVKRKYFVRTNFSRFFDIFRQLKFP